MLKLEHYIRTEEGIKLLWNYPAERIHLGNYANGTWKDIQIDYGNNTYCKITPTEDEFFIIESNE